MALTKAQNRMINNVAYVASGTSSNIVVSEGASTLQSGGWFSVKMINNSFYGMTLNSLPIKVLDIPATEESSWTITSGASATRDQTKVNVYRVLCQAMLSSDVEYQFRYISSGSFYEVKVEHIYKHLFIPCGNGKDITELQDAINFASQFTCSSNMDPEFMYVNAATEYYPNKGMITITLPQGTSGSPVTSTMTKRIRLGESDLSHLEIVNEQWYRTGGSTAPDADACIVNLNFLPSADDTALMNFWRTNLHEIRFITFKFSGQFFANNQAVIKFIDSESKLKDCKIDVSSATVAGGVTNVYGFYNDDVGSDNSNTIKCPSTSTSWLTAMLVASGGSAITIEGKPNIGIEIINDCQFYGLSMPNTPEYMFKCDRGRCSISVNSSPNFKANYIYNLSSEFEGEIYLNSGVALSGITNLSNFEKSINKFDAEFNVIYAPVKGSFKKSWLPYNVITVTSGDTTITVEDSALTQCFIASGSATITQINLANGFSLPSDAVVEIYLRKGGAGTFILGSGGNVLPSNSGASHTITNPNEPISVIWDPSISKWCPVVNF